MPFMKSHRRLLFTSLVMLLAATCASSPVRAERADRNKPLEVEADKNAGFDLGKQVVVLTGNVVIRKGTLTIKADRVEVREGPDGFRTAVAFGGGRPATFRQKRDAVNEYIDGQADKLEYEERGDVIRFINNAIVRRLRGTTVGDEITGNLITYDGTRETFSATSSAANTGAASAPSSTRVRAVLMPREGTEAAAEAARSAEPAAPSASGLVSNPTGGGRR